MAKRGTAFSTVEERGFKGRVKSQIRMGFSLFERNYNTPSPHQFPQKFPLIHPVLKNLPPIDKNHGDFIVELPPQLAVTVHVHFLPGKGAMARKLLQALFHHFTQVTSLA